MSIIKTAATGCKLNYFLKVTGKRADGYHNISTLFHHLPVPSDTIDLQLDTDNGISVSCDRPDLPQDLENLAGKAAQAYAGAAGISPCWKIFIRKGVPSAAGLGGGSADAGCVLRMLEEHYQALGREKLVDIAAGIGADVPFFLEPGLVQAEGIGEKMTRFDTPVRRPELLIVNPGFPVSARWAYCHLAQYRIGEDTHNTPQEIVRALQAGDTEKLACLMHNDLEYALFDKFPLLEVLRIHLKEQNALRVMVSGSGSSLIALFPDAASRKSGAEAVKELLKSDPVSAVFELEGE